jgi:hypothetical protein
MIVAEPNLLKLNIKFIFINFAPCFNCTLVNGKEKNPLYFSRDNTLPA